MTLLQPSSATLCVRLSLQASARHLARAAHSCTRWRPNGTPCDVTACVGDCIGSCCDCGFSLSVFLSLTLFLYLHSLILSLSFSLLLFSYVVGLWIGARACVCVCASYVTSFDPYPPMKRGAKYRNILICFPDNTRGGLDSHLELNKRVRSVCDFCSDSLRLFQTKRRQVALNRRCDSLSCHQCQCQVSADLSYLACLFVCTTFLFFSLFVCCLVCFFICFFICSTIFFLLLVYFLFCILFSYLLVYLTFVFLLVYLFVVFVG